MSCRPSGSGYKLQVYILPDYSFDGVGNLPVESSLKPRSGSAVGYEDQSCGICHLYQSCSGKPVCCLSRREVFFDLLYGVVPDGLIFSLVCILCLFILCIVFSVCVCSIFSAGTFCPR